jgi:hypothetical protein
MDFDQEAAVNHFFNRQCGILHLNWFLDAYWTKVTKEIFIPGLLAIYDKLVEKGIAEGNDTHWGDADGKLYYIPNKDRKVIVFTTQCRDYLFILSPIECVEYFPDAPEGERIGERYESHSLHIRRIWRPYEPGDIYNLKEIKSNLKKMLDSVETLEQYTDDFSQYPQRPSLELYRKINFNLDKYQESPRFYGDFRDSGFILSYNDRYGGRLEGSQYSHNDLQGIATVDLGCMAYEMEVEIPRLNGYGR